MSSGQRRRRVVSAGGAPPNPAFPLISRPQAADVCRNCGARRARTYAQKKTTGLCRTCYDASVHKPLGCLRCGEKDPAQFRPKSRTRCRTCVNAAHAVTAIRTRGRLAAYFAALPTCDTDKGGCGIKDTHVIDGLCPLCRREIDRGRSSAAVADDAEVAA